MLKKGAQSNPLLMFMLPLFLLSHFSLSQSDEVEQLLSFKSSIHDPLDFLSNWNSSVPLCLWHGITCNSFSHVKAIQLSRKEITGTIPASIFHLPNIETIDLSANQLSGEIPPDMVSSASLRHLYLGDNNFSGPIPNCSTSLQTLNLSNNMLFGEIPSRIGVCSSLQTLDLGLNHLEGKIPNVVAYLPHLQSLSFWNNQLSGEIPKSLGKQNNITFLDLSMNNLTGKIPDQLCHSGHLIELRLFSNSLEGQIPRSLSTCKTLEVLHLRYNPLSGLGNDKGVIELDMFSSLQNLRLLDLSDNGLSLRSSINFNYTWTNLKYLRLTSCNLKEFPTFLKVSKYLTALDLSNNNIHGQIPKWMLKVGQDTLNYLNLSHNFLTYMEQLPWKNMDTLDLSSNLIQGALPIPPISISFFSISNNSLAGELSALICNSSCLVLLNLSHNNLTGTIPRCLVNFSKHLLVLDLGKNRFHGTIPDRFDKDCGVTNLNFNGNKLEGSLPPSLANCRNMEVLDLGNNKINDSFPQWLETLPELQVLVLRSNKLHGSLNPKINHSFSKLQILDLSNNDFIGPLPKVYIENMKAIQNRNEERTSSYMEAPKNLPYDRYYSVSLTVKGFEMVYEKIFTTFTSVDLSNNNFQGEIPSAFGKLCSLRGLNLSHNSLSGYIPASMGNMTSLEWLDLSSNILIGQIPNKLTALTFLSILNLSHNQLMGPIPQGKQFNTFENGSYQGNLGLCGLPLSKACKDDGIINQSSKEDTDDSGTKISFGWKVVAIGYGCGVIFGVVVGYLTFRSGEPKWFKTLYHHGNYRRNARRSSPK